MKYYFVSAILICTLLYLLVYLCIPKREWSTNDQYSTNIRKSVQWVNKSSNSFQIHRGGCSIMSSKDLIEYSEKNTFPNGIPRMMHYIYKSDNIARQYLNLILHCMAINSDMKFILWTDYTAYQLMERHFPKSFPMYERFLNGSAERLMIYDVIRYFILYKFGGIYMDMDTKCQIPFQEVMHDHRCFLSREMEFYSQIQHHKEYVAMTSLMGCVAGHDFFRHLTNRSEYANVQGNVLDVTGPLLLTKVFKEYSTSLSPDDVRNVNKTVHLWKAETFSPFVHENDIRVNCLKSVFEIVKRGCEGFRMYRKIKDNLLNEAIVVHLFYHLGYKISVGQITANQDLCMIANVTICRK